MHPLLYEINTRCWLAELSAQAGQPVHLSAVPETEIFRWRALGFTHIWLMGAWTTGPRARAKALSEPGQIKAYSEALPGWQSEDIGGSPYAIADYRVAAEFGGDDALQIFRRKLNEHGMNLLLDFVPNHLGLDHPWVQQRPELFVPGGAESPGIFLQQTSSGPHWLAHGKDPYFAPWTDSVQLDYRRADTRAAMTDLLLGVAAKCDGVRCDMAMLLLQEVFENTWRKLPAQAGAAPAGPSEFWTAAIAITRSRFPNFLFLAEAYWDLEPRLQSLGFDFTYDKPFYDLVLARDAGDLTRRLLATPPALLNHGCRFLENHDERRVASLLSLAEHQAAVLLLLSLPGMRLLHDGQLTGARRRAPVQLLRRAPESPDPILTNFYHELLERLRPTTIGHGSWELLRPIPVSPTDTGSDYVLLIKWQSPVKSELDVAIVNLSPFPVRCLASLPDLRHANQVSPLFRGDATALPSSQGILFQCGPQAYQVFRFAG